MTTVRRAIFFGVFTIATLLSIASPASAHTVSGVGATNFKSEFTGIKPPQSDVHVKIIEAGSRIQMAYSGSGEVIVLGYQNEPYLKVTPQGVWRNQYSPATYINVSRKSYGTVPSNIDPKKPPLWKKISNKPVARWHDHRIHWMLPQPSPQVQAHENVQQVVNPDWQIHLTVDGKAATIHGSLTWVPSSSAVPWLLYILIVAGSLVVLLQLRRVRWFALPVALVSFLLTDMVYRWGIMRGIAEPLATVINRDAEIFIVSQIAWIGLIFCIYLALRKKDDAYVATLFCAVPLVILGGFADIVVLWKSQVPFLYGKETARILLASEIALGVGLSIGCFVYLMRTRQNRHAELAAMKVT